MIDPKSTHTKMTFYNMRGVFCLVLSPKANLNLISCQRELFYSVLETIRVIIRLNSHYCFPVVDFRSKQSSHGEGEEGMEGSLGARSEAS